MYCRSAPGLFDQFEFIDQGEIFKFREYDNLVSFRLARCHSLIRPFIRLQDDIHRVKERRLEEKFNLPNRHLRGLYYNKAPEASAYRIAKRACKTIQNDELKNYVKELIDKSTEKFVQELNSQIQLQIQAQSIASKDFLDKERCNFERSGQLAMAIDQEINQSPVINTHILQPNLIITEAIIEKQNN